MSTPKTILPPVPTVSVRTVHMAGMLVDVYGLDELSPLASRITCLWLHHQRTRRKEALASIAARCVEAWNARLSSQGRGLIAAAFDHRNHGGRIVSECANADWAEGNPTHAQDMLGLLMGAVADQRVLLDVVEGYLFPDGNQVVDRHLALGVSLGGHSVWQAMFAEPRICAGVVVIGCPDLMCKSGSSLLGFSVGSLADRIETCFHIVPRPLPSRHTRPKMEAFLFLGVEISPRHLLTPVESLIQRAFSLARPRCPSLGFRLRGRLEKR